MKRFALLVCVLLSLMLMGVQSCEAQGPGGGGQAIPSAYIQSCVVETWHHPEGWILKQRVTWKVKLVDMIPHKWYEIDWLIYNWQDDETATRSQRWADWTGGENVVLTEVFEFLGGPGEPVCYPGATVYSISFRQEDHVEQVHTWRYEGEQVEYYWYYPEEPTPYATTEEARERSRGWKPKEEMKK